MLKLQALYDIETSLVDDLPDMAEAATDAELKSGFEKHLTETKDQVKRLEEAFLIMKMNPEASKVKAIHGLIDDAKWLTKKVRAGTVLDASLVSAALDVECYEIGAYGSAIEWAELLEQKKIKALLEKTLAEEQKTADALTLAGAEKLYEQALGSDENTEPGEADV